MPKVHLQVVFEVPNEKQVDPSTERVRSALKELETGIAGFKVGVSDGKQVQQSAKPKSGSGKKSRADG